MSGRLRKRTLSPFPGPSTMRQPMPRAARSGMPYPYCSSLVTSKPSKNLVDLDPGPRSRTEANEQAHGPAVIGGKVEEGRVVSASDHVHTGVSRRMVTRRLLRHVAVVCDRQHDNLVYCLLGSQRANRR